MAQPKLSGIGSWIKESLAIYFRKENFIYLTKFVLLQLLLMVVMAFVFFVAGGFENFIDKELPSIVPGMWPLLFVFTFVVIFFNLWVYIAIIKAISQVVAGKILGVKETLKLSSNRILPLIFTGILMGIIVLGGFILLIVPGVIFLTWFYFSQYVAVTEGLGPIASLKRSRFLVKGYFWPVLGRVVVYFLYIMVITGVSSMVLQPLIYTIAYTLIGPYFYIMPYLLYSELKEIKK